MPKRIKIIIPGLGEYYVPRNMRDVNEVKTHLDRKFQSVKQFASQVWGGMSPLDKAALGTAPVPVIGDITGLMADADHYIRDPESRTLVNYGLSAAGLLPMVPALTVSKHISNALPAAKRMENAKEGGFFDNTLYHGTAAKEGTIMDDGNLFDFFKKWEGDDLAKSTVGSPVSKLGVSLGEQPQVAEDFARLASPDGNEGAAIMPLKFRADKVGAIDLVGDESNDDIYNAVLESWDDGFDAIHFTNYTTPQGNKGSFVMVKDPNQIRSTHANFDPLKRNSKNLMAGGAGAAVGLKLYNGNENEN